MNRFWCEPCGYKCQSVNILAVQDLALAHNHIFGNKDQKIGNFTQTDLKRFSK